MALINFMGGIGATVEGVNKGAREQRADNKQQDVDAYEGKVRDAETSLLPSKTEAAQADIDEKIDNSKDRKALSPGIQSLRVQQQDNDLKNAPEKLRQQNELLQNSAYANVIANSKSRQEAEQGVLGVAGEHLAKNDIGGFNAILKEVWPSPLFPGTNNLPAPVSTAVVDAPAGTKDMSGNLLTGKALQITLADGSTRLINPQKFSDAYQLRRQTMEKSQGYNLKLGEQRFDANNKPIAQNSNKYNEDGSPMPFTDGDGNVLSGGRGVGSAGAGKGAGGKAEVTPVMAAVKFSLDKDTTLTPDQRNNAQDYARTISALDGMSPETAARVAVGAAQQVPDGKDSKLTTMLDVKTGYFGLFYTDPQIAGGTPVPIAPNTTKASAIVGKKTTASVQGQIGEMLDLMSGGDPAKALQWQEIAADPKARAAAIAQAKLTPGDPKSVQDAVNKLIRQLDLLPYGPKIQAQPAVAAQPGGVSQNARGEGGPGIGATADNRVPDPPPQNLPASGIRAGRANPEYAAWQERYGSAWAQQNSVQASQSSAQALSVKKSYNPYSQNSVK